MEPNSYLEQAKGGVTCDVSDSTHCAYLVRISYFS